MSDSPVPKRPRFVLAGTSNKGQSQLALNSPGLPAQQARQQELDAAKDMNGQSPAPARAQPATLDDPRKNDSLSSDPSANVSGINNTNGSARNAADADKMIGKTIGEKYMIEGQLGQGGMGTVYVASDKQSGIKVAVKFVLNEDDKSIKRFQKREAEALVEVNHPNVVKVLDVGIHTDPDSTQRPYIVMELLEGRDLGEVLKEETRLRVDRTIMIGIQICKAMEAVHAKKIVHRDIKPSNIFLARVGDDHEFVKVIDFGLVKFEDREALESSISSAGAMLGTPFYISPEAIQGLRVSDKSDVFSIGVLLYKMVSGRYPFVGDNPNAVSLQIISQDPPIPSAACPEANIPGDMDQLIMSALRKYPGPRPDAGTLRQGLEACAEGRDGLRLSMERTVEGTPESFGAASPSSPTLREGAGKNAAQPGEEKEEGTAGQRSDKTGGQNQLINKSTRKRKIVLGIIAAGALSAGTAGALLYQNQASELAHLGNQNRPAASSIVSATASQKPTNGKPKQTAEPLVHKVIVTSDPKGAIVYVIEGSKMRRLGLTLNNLEVELPPGKQTIILQTNGYTDRKVEVPDDAKAVNVIMASGKTEISK